MSAAELLMQALAERDQARAAADTQAAEVARRTAENDRLRAQLAEATTRIDELEEAIAGHSCNGAECDAMAAELRQLRERYGKAVAALQDMVYLQWNIRYTNGDQRKVDNARAILADPTSTAAVEAYRAQQEERRLIDEVYASHNQRGDDGPCDCGYCRVLVDARRGGGAK